MKQQSKSQHTRAPDTHEKETETTPSLLYRSGLYMENYLGSFSNDNMLTDLHIDKMTHHTESL